MRASRCPPPRSGRGPATVNVFTVDKAIQRNGVDFNLPQIFFQSVKGSLMIDRQNCRPSSKRVALKPSSALSGPQVVTPTYLGSLNQRCVTTKRVLVHLRITMQSGAPAQALVAVRDAGKTRKPVALLDWKPRKINGYFGKSCVANGTG